MCARALVSSTEILVVPKITLLFLDGGQNEEQHSKNPQWPEEETCNHKHHAQNRCTSYVPIVKWFLGFRNLLATMLANLRIVLEVCLRTKGHVFMPVLFCSVSLGEG